MKDGWLRVAQEQSSPSYIQNFCSGIIRFSTIKWVSKFLSKFCHSGASLQEILDILLHVETTFGVPVCRYHKLNDPSFKCIPRFLSDVSPPLVAFPLLDFTYEDLIHRFIRSPDHHGTCLLFLLLPNEMILERRRGRRRERQ
jgi:hypothetical protein